MIVVNPNDLLHKSRQTLLTRHQQTVLEILHQFLSLCQRRTYTQHCASINRSGWQQFIDLEVLNKDWYKAAQVQTGKHSTV